MARPASPAVVSAIMGVLCLCSTGIVAWGHFAGAPRGRIEPPIDHRYRELIAALPPDPVLRYVSDHPGKKQHQQAIYALAPRVLLPSTIEARHGVADLADPRLLSELSRRAGMRPIAVFHEGRVALLERAR